MCLREVDLVLRSQHLRIPHSSNMDILNPFKKIVKLCAVSILLSICLLTCLTKTAQADDPPFLSDQAGSGAEKIAPELQESLKLLGPEDMLTVIIRLEQQVNLQRLAISPTDPNRSQQQKNLVQGLQETAKVNQKSLKTFLQSKQAEGRVSEVVEFWIFNGLAVTATADVIQALAALSEVLSISPNETVQAPIAPPLPPLEPRLGILSANQANLDVINVPALWNLGFKGQGVVVANMDTGVGYHETYFHPDLWAKWRNGSNSWFDPYGQNATPTDLNGHGTWTMGTIVGGEDTGTAFGVAPEAQWIAAKIFNNSGSGTEAAVHLAFQWLLDPDGNPATADAPHVVNNSWTWSAGCNLDFQADLQALRAGGILPIFAAGNNALYSYSPANNPEAFAVGATDNNDLIWAEPTQGSSLGPSACDSTTFPEVVAPGVSIHTTGLYNGYFNATGTSLATPHVAGVLALLLEAFPNATVAEQEAALLNSVVDLGTSGADNTYGYGRIDALAAYLYLKSAKSDASTIITPTISSSLVYTDTQYNPTSIFIPTGAVTQETRLYFTAITTTNPAPSGAVSGGHAFTLDAYQSGTLFQDFSFNQPVTVTLYYSDNDMVGLDENNLLLYYWDEGQNQWVDVATTCTPNSTYSRHPAENWLAVSICHLSEFALFGPSPKQWQTYLPVIIKND